MSIKRDTVWNGRHRKGRAPGRWLIALLASVISFGTAKAQTSPTSDESTTQLQEIVVTGSNIKRAEAETVANVQVVTAQEIRKSGQSTVADYLRTI